MTLAEVAEGLATRMNAEVVPGDDPFQIKVQGKGYHFVVATFFGGWQSTLYLPDQEPTAFYAETAEMIEARMRAKLTGKDHQF
jgi:hypothetical protein